MMLKEFFNDKQLSSSQISYLNQYIFCMDLENVLTNSLSYVII